MSFTAKPTAFYVRHGDQLRQVVFLSCRPEGLGGNAARPRTQAESGDCTIIDTNHPFDRDTKVALWQVYGVRAGKIQFQVYRQRGGNYVLVGESKPQTMQPGLNRFQLEKPIAAKKGDHVGFSLSGDGAAIAADQGGESFAVTGQQTERSTPVKSWKVQSRIYSICAAGEEQIADLETWNRLLQSGKIEVASALEKRSISLASLAAAAMTLSWMWPK